jgi:hypothetical protein
MNQPPPKPRVRVFWWAVYTLLCGCEFVIEVLKDFARERVTGQKPDEGDDGR